MRKWLKTALTAALATSFALTAAACGGDAAKVDAAEQYALPYYDQSADDVYNDDLFYRNDMKAACADPTVIYIDDESDPDYGWFFMYPTSDSDFGCHGYSTYRSRDMETWEYLGPVFEPEIASWSHRNMWAPEVIRDEETGKYYLFYSAIDDERTDERFFDSRAEEKEYHATEKIVKAYSADEAIAAMDAEIEKFSGDGAFGDYTAEQKNNILNEINNYGSRKTQVENNAQMTDGQKKNAIGDYAREATLKIRTAKIHYSTSGKGYSIGVAVSDSPRGPFRQYVNEEGSDGYNPNNRALSISDAFIRHEDLFVGTVGKYGYHDVFVPIDVHPYVDPATGKKYIYFANTHMGNNVYGVEAGEKWTDDPKWETLTYLARTGYQTVDGNTRTDYGDDNINEGPYMYYDAETKTYYLTFSINGYPNKMYAVAQAVGKSPLGPFTKINRKDGGLIISSQPEWDHASGTGHHSFVRYDGKLYIVYHAHYNRQYGGNGQRGSCVDEVRFFTRPDGQKLMIANGPSYSIMPKIGRDAQYKNIAGDATITVTEGTGAEYLNDGLIAFTTFHNYIGGFDFDKQTTITLKFSDYRAIRSVMIFNNNDLDTMFENVSRIEFDFVKTDKDGNEQKSTAYIADLKFDKNKFTTAWDPEDNDENYARPGGSVTVEFDELKVNEIRITVPTDKPVRISEIYVLGR